MSANTLGPWDTPFLTPHPFSVWKGNTQIAACRWSDDHLSVAPECVQDEHEAKANARLIAAAPDLWDIVETIAKLIDDGAPVSMILDENSPTLDAIRDVIAKIKGAAS